MQRRHFDEEQRRFIIQDVQAKKASGEKTIEQACADNGVNPSVYYGWLRSAEAPKRKRRETLPVPVVHHTFPIGATAAERTSRGITIKGSPEDLGAFLRAVANGGG